MKLFITAQILWAANAQLKGRLEHWVSREAMDIDGIGESLISQLIEENLLKTLRIFIL